MHEQILRVSFNHESAPLIGKLFVANPTLFGIALDLDLAAIAD